MYEITHTWYLKKPNSESKMVVTGGKGSRIGWMLFKGTNLQPIVNKS